jgi:ankyrin repeat protein
MSTVDGSHSTEFHKACAKGHISTAKLLIQRGASSNLQQIEIIAAKEEK